MWIKGLILVNKKDTLLQLHVSNSKIYHVFAYLFDGVTKSIVLSLSLSRYGSGLQNI